MLDALSNMLDFNKSVMSGAMDVIVVKQKDGSFKSTPFYVRFGSFKLFKSKEKVVTIEVNGVETSAKMKLSSTGDGYFTIDIENKKEIDLIVIKEDSMNTTNKKRNTVCDTKFNNLNESFESVKQRSLSIENVKSRLSKKEFLISEEYIQDGFSNIAKRESNSSIENQKKNKSSTVPSSRREATSL